MVMMQDRRNSKRLPLSTPIRYQQKTLQRFGRSIGRDISDSGIGFISNEFFPVYAPLVFEVQHPESSEFIKVEGEIVWISKEGHSERFSVGAKFTALPVPI